MKKSFFMFLISMLTGTYLIIIGTLILIDRRELLNNNPSETVAIVTEITSPSISSYSIYVEYMVDGVTYNNRLYILKHETYIGEEVPIYYSANNPNNIMVKDIDREQNKFSYLIFGISAVFAGLTYMPNRRRERKWRQ